MGIEGIGLPGGGAGGPVGDLIFWDEGIVGGEAVFAAEVIAETVAAIPEIGAGEQAHGVGGGVAAGAVYDGDVAGGGGVATPEEGDEVMVSRAGQWLDERRTFGVDARPEGGEGVGVAVGKGAPQGAEAGAEKRAAVGVGGHRTSLSGHGMLDGHAGYKVA